MFTIVLNLFDWKFVDLIFFFFTSQNQVKMYPPKKEALHASSVCPGLLHQNDRGSSHHSSQVNGVYLVDQETPSSRISWPGRLPHQSCPFVKGYRQRMFYSTSSSVKNLSKSKELIYRVFL